MKRMRGRVVVGGGSGFVGRRLVEELATRGYEVVVLSRSPERARRLPEGARALARDGDWAGELGGRRGRRQPRGREYRRRALDGATKAGDPLEPRSERQEGSSTPSARCRPRGARRCS